MISIMIGRVQLDDPIYKVMILCIARIHHIMHLMFDYEQSGVKHWDHLTKSSIFICNSLQSTRTSLFSVSDDFLQYFAGIISKRYKCNSHMKCTTSVHICCLT